MRKIAKSSNSFFIVITSFTLLSLLLFWPIFLGKVNLNGNLLVSFYSPYGRNLPYKNTGWDQLRIYFPFYRVTLDQLKQLQIPLWNPYAFSGHSHMADFQTAVFYPLNIFGLFFAQIEFWHLLRITPTILASFFTYLYLTGLKLSFWPRVFGALTFGFSPFILTWGEEVVMSPHSIVWLPLILYAIDRYLQLKQKKMLAIIALSSTFSFFGGYMQTSIYMSIFVFSYLIFKLNLKKLFLTKIGMRLFFSFLMGIAIASIQLMPSAELFFNAARSEVTLTNTLFRFLLPIESLITYLAPDFFGSPATGNFFRQGAAQYYEGIMFIGVIVLIFASYSIFSKKDRTKDGFQKLTAFLTIFGLFSLSTTLDLPTSKLFLSLPIPFLSTSIANRVLFLPAFCLAIIGAIGFEKWLMAKNREIFKTIASFAILYLVIFAYLIGSRFSGFAYFSQNNLPGYTMALVSLRNLVIPVSVFVLSSILLVVASIKPEFKKQAVILIIILAFAHTFYFSQKYFSFSHKKYIFPNEPILEFIQNNQGYDRSWGLGSGYFENNFASQYEFFWPGGYDSLNNRSYAEFTFSGIDIDLDDFSFRADAGLGGKDKIDEIFRDDKRRIADLLGVKYVISTDEDTKILEENNFKKVFSASVFDREVQVFDSETQTRGTESAQTRRAGGFAVFENLEVLPRVFLASNYEGPPQIDSTGKTDEEIQKERRKLIPKKLLGENFDFKNVLILESPSPISPQFGPGKAEIISYKPHEVIVKTESAQPKLLFLSDNYYPGWKAQVDGEQTPILRANYTFRAVPLIPGEHVVRFYFDSDIFKLGLLISLASLVALFYLTLRKNLLTG